MSLLTKRKHQIAALCLALCSLLVAPCFPVQAQQAKKVPCIGYLGNTASTAGLDMKVFRERLKDLGYIEGQNITIEYRYFDGKVERLPDLVGEMLRLNCEVIVAIGNEAVRALKNATKQTPIVMASTNDAVTSGFVASLAHPGGNITGLTNVGAQVYGKRLELLREVIPKLSRVGFLWSPTSPIAAANLKESDSVARALRLEFISLEAKESADIEKGFQVAVSKYAGALLVEAGAFVAAHRKQIIDLALKHRLPTMYPTTRYVEAGGLMAYGIDRSEQYRRAATYVDKVLKGAKPADLPVEQPMKFELVINLKTAKQIGLTIPPNVLARADRVIR
jgi:putative ABC transport system substrate-binding protein